MSLEGLATVVRFGKSSLARFENADSMIPPELPARLDTAFGTDGIFAELYQLARREIHPDQFRRRMDLEARARLIEEYSGQIVPGLVQTKAYARAQFEAHDPKATQDKIDELVTARLTRQTLLHGSDAPDHSLILDEAVIRRPFGSPTVMREQLSKLIDIAATTSIIQVLPFSSGAHGLVGGSLTLMTLTDGTQIAYEESISTGTLLEDKAIVSERQRAYDRIRADALSRSKTATFIRNAMEALPS